MNLLDQQLRSMDQEPRALIRSAPLLRADCLLSGFATVTPVRGPWTAAIASSLCASYGLGHPAQLNSLQSV